MSPGGEVMIVLTKNSRIYEVSSFINPRPKELAFIDGASPRPDLRVAPGLFPNATCRLAH